jgi:hypothetical protein
MSKEVIIMAKKYTPGKKSLPGKNTIPNTKVPKSKGKC